MIIVVIQNGNNSSITDILYKSEVPARSTILIYIDIVEYTGQFRPVFAPTYRGDKYVSKKKVYMPRWYSNRNFSGL